MKVEVVRNVFESNDIYAHKNKKILKENDIFTVNIISSPGAGKTSLLEKIIPRLKEQMGVAVIEGDLYTEKDALRIKNLGVQVIQINTEGACHLDARMVFEAIKQLDLTQIDLLIIENVGNLVCPAEFDIGEDMKIHIASVTEGNDKPLKYPLVYEKSKLVLLNKMDLMPYTDFDKTIYKRDILSINPKLIAFDVSAQTEAGLKEVTRWLVAQVKQQN